MNSQSPNELKAALEWAESFYDNMREFEDGTNVGKAVPRELLLACGALKIIIRTLKERATPPELVPLERKSVFSVVNKHLQDYSSGYGAELLTDDICQRFGQSGVDWIEFHKCWESYNDHPRNLTPSQWMYHNQSKWLKGVKSES